MLLRKVPLTFLTVPSKICDIFMHLTLSRDHYMNGIPRALFVLGPDGIYLQKFLYSEGKQNISIAKIRKIKYQITEMDKIWSR